MIESLTPLKIMEKFTPAPGEIVHEHNLIEKAKKDLIAFGGLYEKYYGKILDYFSRHINDSLMAEVLTQETFISAICHLQNFETKDNVPVGAWFYTIARNKKTNWFRDNAIQRKRYFPLTPNFDKNTDGSHNPQRVAERDEEQTQVRKAILELESPKQKRALYLKFWYGLSDKQIADELGKTLGAAKILLHRGKENIKKILKKNDFSYSSDY